MTKSTKQDPNPVVRLSHLEPLTKAFQHAIEESTAPLRQRIEALESRKARSAAIARKDRR